ncbi:hypothetical protein HanPSC8_Chr03g0088601 [Helianthus annuus]|nr:hypothetical protein HanPSC8_Chr03g0088601 [Helianthus annuus]
MLFEYGIRSIYLKGTNDHIMMAFEHKSTRGSLSFHVPLHPDKYRIQGLKVSCLYRFLGSKDKDKWPFFIRICNKTKGVTWIYNPLVYRIPKVDEDSMWISYWPIGNILDIGDKVKVSTHAEKGIMVSKCGASLVYMGDGEVEHEENLENMTMKMKEVIGGDLSDFEVSRGVYYVCRRDFFKSTTLSMIKRWFGDSIPYIELQGWRKSIQSEYLDASFMHLEYIEELHEDTLHKEILLRLFNSKSDICKIEMMVSRLVGVEDVHYFVDKNMLSVSGCVDSMAVETCVREFERTAIFDDANTRNLSRVD